MPSHFSTVRDQQRGGRWSVSAGANLPLFSWGVTPSPLLTLLPHAAGDPPPLADEVFRGGALPRHPTQTRQLDLWFDCNISSDRNPELTISTSKFGVILNRDFDKFCSLFVFRWLAAQSIWHFLSSFITLWFIFKKFSISPEIPTYANTKTITKHLFLEKQIGNKIPSYILVLLISYSSVRNRTKHYLIETTLQIHSYICTYSLQTIQFNSEAMVYYTNRLSYIGNLQAFV
jgi:hypothetical protein